MASRTVSSVTLKDATRVSELIKAAGKISTTATGAIMMQEEEEELERVTEFLNRLILRASDISSKKKKKRGSRGMSGDQKAFMKFYSNAKSSASIAVQMLEMQTPEQRKSGMMHICLNLNNKALEFVRRDVCKEEHSNYNVGDMVDIARSLSKSMENAQTYSVILAIRLGSLLAIAVEIFWQLKKSKKIDKQIDVWLTEIFGSKLASQRDLLVKLNEMYARFPKIAFINKGWTTIARMKKKFFDYLDEEENKDEKVFWQTLSDEMNPQTYFISMDPVEVTLRNQGVDPVEEKKEDEEEEEEETKKKTVECFTPEQTKAIKRKLTPQVKEEKPPLPPPPPPQDSQHELLFVDDPPEEDKKKKKKKKVKKVKNAKKTVEPPSPDFVIEDEDEATDDAHSLSSERTVTRD